MAKVKSGYTVSFTMDKAGVCWSAAHGPGRWGHPATAEELRGSAAYSENCVRAVSHSINGKSPISESPIGHYR